MRVVKNLVSTIESEIETIEIHAILKLISKLKSNWPLISVIDIEIKIHFKIEIKLGTLWYWVSCILKSILIFNASGL